MAEDISRAHYVLLTTYRRDGTPVGTPVWAVEDSGRLLLWTETDSFKVRRIRRDPTVSVRPCTFRGVVYGQARRGRAELLDRAGTDRVRKMLARKYGIWGRLAVRWPWPSYFRPSRRLIRDVVTGNRPATVGIAISFDPM
ncbi:PPOX class F420-dependent oxidoreductase [Nocardia sp. CDC159]|uniref:PPOX class F420-dependent oxidoreductase n=1 Tax=Nocardia pulmonis TaxID=2951408 RepID=A0A9X2E420_9NOCA|nr:MULTISPECIES: PPOX class F420-dependent oxidoreductase [Nocardia]MCM6773255.1 PPOX class F420-dependent oxidoreductase [Nocardia pulmonis]MCM6786142.1 PPOX class F420-dependent oxidoreductase [Nocardia sp. CDC159]